MDLNAIKSSLIYKRAVDIEGVMLFLHQEAFTLMFNGSCSLYDQTQNRGMCERSTKESDKSGE